MWGRLPCTDLSFPDHRRVPRFSPWGYGPATLLSSPSNSAYCLGQSICLLSRPDPSPGPATLLGCLQGASHSVCPHPHPHVAPAPWSHPRDPGPVPGQAPGVILDCSCLPLTPLTLLPVSSTPSAPPPSLGFVTEASGLVFLPSFFPWCALVTSPQCRPLG